MKRSPPVYRELPPQWLYRIQGWAQISLDPNKKLRQTTEVVRWGDYHRLGLKIPVQTVPDHIRGLSFWISMFIRFLAPYQPRPYDILMLFDSINHHDLPELLLKNRRHSQFDISDPRKTSDHDLEENAAHAAAFVRSSTEAQHHYRQAYLLPMVVKKTAENKKLLSRLGRNDRRIVARLKKSRYQEALLFNALEHFEYLIYCALCATQDAPIYRLAQDLVPIEVPILDRLAELIPGFKKTIWTTELRDWFLQFAPKNS